MVNQSTKSRVLDIHVVRWSCGSMPQLIITTISKLK